MPDETQSAMDLEQTRTDVPPPPFPLRILVAEDEELIHRFMRTVLEKAGHHVQVVDAGRPVFDILEREPVDLLILDRGLPDISGLEVCRRVRADPLLQSLPIIMVTGYQQLEQKLEGFSQGVDDYITKPFRTQEFLARILAVYQRCQRNLEASPLTRLPGNGALEREILRRMGQKAKFAVLYCDINHFKSYNDAYGFLAGDNVIRQTARLILSCTNSQTDFVGHVGGDDFVIITSLERSKDICEAVVKGFDAMAPGLYNEIHRLAGHVVTVDRLGNSRQFPLISIAIGGVSNGHRDLTSLGEISTLGAEMKHFVKQQNKSAYAFDRRRSWTWDAAPNASTDSPANPPQR